jgi:hypothetical protein
MLWGVVCRCKYSPTRPVIASFSSAAFALCSSSFAPDYSVTLKSIGESVRTLTNSVALAHTPVAGSVMVTFTPNQSITYKVIGNRVVFDSPPSVGTQIKVDYQY